MKLSPEVHFSESPPGVLKVDTADHLISGAPCKRQESAADSRNKDQCHLRSHSLQLTARDQTSLPTQSESGFCCNLISIYGVQQLQPDFYLYRPAKPYTGVDSILTRTVLTLACSHAGEAGPRKTRNGRKGMGNGEWGMSIYWLYFK